MNMYVNEFINTVLMNSLKNKDAPKFSLFLDFSELKALYISFHDR